ncbi:MAG TPA: LamG domain-containing protein [Anaerolineae bacterium]
MSDSNEGLVLHLKLDEITDGQVADASGTIGPGTINGEPEAVPDDAFGSRLIFDGASDFVALGNPSELQITGNQTIEMWLRPDNFNQRRNPYAKAYGGEGAITQEVDGRLNYYHGTNGGNGKPYQGFQSLVSIPLNEWTHVAVVRDLDNRKLYWYINGTKRNEAEASYAAAKAGSLEAYVGKGYTQNYAGSIANLRIYNRALSAEEIRQDIATDQMASAAFRRSHPLEFRLYDDDDQPAIFISDDPAGGALLVEVSNVSPQTIRAAALSEPPDPTNHHLELRFRPDTLSVTSLGSQGIRPEA